MKRIRFGSVVAFLFALAIAAPALVSVRPDLLVEATKVTLRSPVAQVLAMRGWIAAGLAGGAVFFALMGAVRKHLLDRGRVALFLAAMLLAAAAGHVGVMVQRGVFPVSELPKAEGSLRVLEFNTMGGAVPVETLAALIEENAVDVATLPETAAATGRELAELLAAKGHKYYVFDNGVDEYASAYHSTVILLSAELGEYRHDPAFADASNIHALMVSPVSGEGPSFVAVHPVSPSQAMLRSWRVDVLEAYSMCAEHPNIIMGGDFNSTADHEAALHLGTPCRDAGAEAAAGAVGTWPSNLPDFFSAPIDRVLTNSTYKGSRAKVVKAGESDHKGIVVELAPRG